MRIIHFTLNQFRCFDHLCLDLHDQINLFVGVNGAGKTSVLEAIHVAATGKSFRTHQQHALFKFDCLDYWVTADVNSDEPLNSSLLLGLSKERKSVKSEKITHSLFKVNGEKQKRLSDYASYVPSVVIDSDIFSLIDGGGQKRRQLLDMILFHVEQDFYSSWSKLNRALESKKLLLKRYAALYSKTSQDDLDNKKTIKKQLPFLNKIIAEASQVIDEMRLDLVTKLVSSESKVPKFFNDDQCLEIQFKPYSSNYKEKLSQVLERELLLGKVQASSHKSDLEFFFNKREVKSNCSRGEKKLITCYLYSRIVSYLSSVAKKPIVLIDDLPAEFDINNQKKLLNSLLAEKVQLFISAIDATGIVKQLPNDSYKVFHVEHLKEQNKQEVKKFHVEH